VTDVTRILSAIEHGEPQAAERLLPLVYEQLRKLAAHKLAHEKPGQTLQATALVHEAYLRLVDQDQPQEWDGRGHFFAAAAEAEPFLRECLAIREKSSPDNWATFNPRSLLGGSLLGQKKYAEAEPLVLSGCDGMKAREVKIPGVQRWKLTKAGERVLELYESWGKPDQAADWQKKLGLSSPDFPSDVFAR
jgi:ECF sigma factor